MAMVQALTLPLLVGKPVTALVSDQWGRNRAVLRISETKLAVRALVMRREKVFNPNDLSIGISGMTPNVVSFWTPGELPQRHFGSLKLWVFSRI